jgi:spore germination cell wall hydrolase CwlJ-like protein
MSEQPETYYEIAAQLATKPYSTELDVLARTIYGEAASDGADGMTAVASVIVNRAKSSINWWGKDITGVCLAPLQFSCNNTAASRAKLAALTDTDPVFKTAQALAVQAVAGTLADTTQNADHYYAAYIPPPSWALGKAPVATIGKQLFFRLYLPPPASPPATIDPASIASIQSQLADISRLVLTLSDYVGQLYSKVTS